MYGNIEFFPNFKGGGRNGTATRAKKPSITNRPRSRPTGPEMALVALVAAGGTQMSSRVHEDDGLADGALITSILLLLSSTRALSFTRLVATRRSWRDVKNFESVLRRSI